MTRFLQSDFLVFCFIFLCIIFSYGSLLNAYYLFHDDWTLYLLEKENIIDTIRNHRYRSAHTEMGRPLGHVFFSIGPYFVDKIEDANLIRFISLLLSSFFGYLLFKILTILKYNKIFSLLFVVLFLLTPPFYILNYQLAGQYIIICLIFSSIFMLLSIDYFMYSNKFLKTRKNNYIVQFFLFVLFVLGFAVNTKFFIYSLVILLLYSFVIFYLSKRKIIIQENCLPVITCSIILYYALSIYATAALIVIALPIFIFLSYDLKVEMEKKKKFIIKYVSLVVTIILIYFLTFKSLSFFENMQYASAAGRRFAIDFYLFDKIKFYIFDVFPHAISLWRIDTKLSFISYLLTPFSILYFTIICLKKYNLSNSIFILCLILLSLFLTIAPIIMIQDNFFSPYRAMIGHMLILYFLIICFFYYIIKNSKLLKRGSLIIFVIIFINYANWPNEVIYNYVIKPTETELNYINSQIDKLDIPTKIKNGEHITLYFNKLRTHSMHQNLIQNMVVLAASGYNMPWVPEIIYGLLSDKHGIKYRLQRKDINEKIMNKNVNGKMIQYIEVEFPWGNLIYSSDIKAVYGDSVEDYLFIDMNKINQEK